MNIIKFRWMRTVSTGLVLLAQVLFLTSFTYAQNTPIAQVASKEMFHEDQMVDLAAEEWNPIIRQIRSSYFQQAYLKADNVEAEDRFGISIAIDGDTLVVGAYYEASDGTGPENNDADEAGAVYVFERRVTGWAQQAYLKAGNVEAGDHFGRSVAIDGDTIVVGADREDSDGTGPYNNSAENAGAAYVFVRSGKSWIPQAYLKASNAEAGDHFGEAVAIYGNAIVVGADGEDSDGTGPENNDAESAGAAYVFMRSGEEWTQQAYLKAANAEANDYFAFSLAIDGNTIVAGAYGEDSDGTGPENNDASRSGAAYVFVWDTVKWTQQAYLKASNAESDDYLGDSVSIFRDILVVGATGESSNGTSPENNDEDSAGAAYVFTRRDASWAQRAYLKAGNADEYDNFGLSIAIEGGTIVVGAGGECSDGTGQENNSAEAAGAVYVFVYSGGEWPQQAYLKAANADAYDVFGFSVAMSSDSILVGAYGEASDGTGPMNNDADYAGAAYVFDFGIPLYLPLILR